MSVNVKVRVERSTTVDVEVDVPESEIASGIREAITAGMKRCDDHGKNETGDAAGGDFWVCRVLSAVLWAMRGRA